jgi:hypothetical protein
MSDNNEEYPETGTGGGGITLVTDPGRTENAVEQDESTTPQMGQASEGGKFISPNPPNGGEGNTGRARAPSERGSAGSENSVSEQDLTGRVQLTAEEIQAQEVSNAPAGASKLQDDVGGVNAASAKERTTVPDVPLMPMQMARENTVEERHEYYDEIRSAEPEREYKEGQGTEPEVGPVKIVVNEQPGMQTPNTGIQTEYSTNQLLQGDSRRSTINGIIMSNAPAGASKLQDDVGGKDAASLFVERTTVPDVPLMPMQMARENTVEERHEYYGEIRSAEPEREYKEGQESEPEGGPVQIVVNEQPGMQTPNTGIVKEYSTNHISQESDNRRSTINGIMDVLGTQSKLEMKLKDIKASPIHVTVEAVEKASLHILYMYTKESEVHIEAS